MSTWQLYLYIIKLNSWQKFEFARFSNVSSKTFTLCLFLCCPFSLHFPLWHSPWPCLLLPTDLRPTSGSSSIPTSLWDVSPDSLTSLKSPSLENSLSIGICHYMTSGITPIRYLHFNKYLLCFNPLGNVEIVHFVVKTMENNSGQESLMVSFTLYYIGNCPVYLLIMKYNLLFNESVLMYTDISYGFLFYGCTSVAFKLTESLILKVGKWEIHCRILWVFSAV